MDLRKAIATTDPLPHNRETAHYAMGRHKAIAATDPHRDNVPPITIVGVRVEQE
jgi:hypothetical protein